MAIAAAAARTFPTTHHRSDPSLTTSSLRSPSTPLSLRPISLKSAFPNPRLFSVSASSMSFQATEKIPQASFLDSRESTLQFVKYHGLGNDFILVDNRGSMEPRVTPEQAVKLCDRNFGIGADGVIFVMPGINGSDYTMRIFNSDGNEPEMCGNGVRCFARFIAELENIQGKQSFTIHTGAGLIVPELQDDGKLVMLLGVVI